MTINDYCFGKIIIDKKAYHNSDLIIGCERVEPWVCPDHHHPTLEDFKNILETPPDVLVIGTGYSGMMEFDPEIKTKLEEKIAKVVVSNTRKAAKLYNKLTAQNKKVIACLHLTC